MSYRKETEYKYIRHGDKFEFNGQVYIKTNHNRGYFYDKNGNIIHKNFKKSKRVIALKDRS